MRFTFFQTPKPKQFKYRPRYYDKDKEELERRKAELGYNSTLSHQETLRRQINKRWRRAIPETGTGSFSRLLYYLFYAVVIIGGVYVIFFTAFVDKLVAFFGVGG